MKSNTFNYSLLAVGVAAVMGLSSGANAATPATAASSGDLPIVNVATANYSVAGIAQPLATSNSVIVNVSETANFALVSTVPDGIIGDDIAVNQTAIPGGNTTFTHALTNTGNVTDTYTIRTTGEDSPLVTAIPNYALGLAGANGITYTILKADNSVPSAAELNGQAQTGTISNGETIKLSPKLKANLSYAAATPSTQDGNHKGVGTLTATSTFFTTAGRTVIASTVTNENQTIVRLPTFRIAKAATSNVDLTATTPQIFYSILVTNATTDYSAAATDFVIRDVLPVGLTLPNNATSDVTITGAGTATISTIGTRQAIDVAVANLPVGESLTIAFTVNVDRAQYAGSNSSVTNNVEVYDKIIGAVGVLPGIPLIGTNYDILDSTQNNTDVTRVPAAADESGGTGIDTAGVTSFTRRATVLSNPTIREIAPASGTAGQVTHTTIITNNGQDNEGTTTNPLSFTIADGGNNPNVRPVDGDVSVTYTPPGTSPILVTVTITPIGGVYTLNSTTLPTAQFPNGIAPGGTLAINYKVSSGNVTNPAIANEAAVVGSTESTVVTLTPTGTGASVPTLVTDRTNVRGLTLAKTQSLDVTCAGTVVNGTFVDTAIDAEPDQCVIYRIQATNTSSAIQTANPAAASGFDITGLTILDSLSNFSAGADLVAGSPASSATAGSTIGTAAAADSTAVTTIASTLAPQGVATLTFKIKIKNNR